MDITQHWIAFLTFLTIFKYKSVIAYEYGNRYLSVFLQFKVAVMFQNIPHSFLLLCQLIKLIFEVYEQSLMELIVSSGRKAECRD